MHLVCVNRSNNSRFSTLSGTLVITAIFLLASMEGDSKHSIKEDITYTKSNARIDRFCRTLFAFGHMPK